MLQFLRSYQSRISVLLLIALLLLTAKYLMTLGQSLPLEHARLYDLGYHYVPPLEQLLGKQTSEWVWWFGSMSIELAFAAVILSILFKGVGLRLGLSLSVIVLLHSLFWHITILPVPVDNIWQFPFITGQIAKPDDFWFSGHVAYAFLLALSSRQQARWLQLLSWLYVLLIILLVLSTRTHYSIDIIGAFFVAYTVREVIFYNGSGKRQ